MILDAWLAARGRRARMRWAWILLVGISLLHFALGSQGEGIRHVLHVGLAVLYLAPIALAARIRGTGGGFSLALAASALYLVHVATRDPEPSSALLDAAAVVAGFIAFGGLVGYLAREAERRREERDRVLLAARRSEIRSGLEALVEVLGARDGELAEHSQRVAELGELVARRLGLDRAQRAEIHLAGLLQDLGKVALSDDVLFGAGALSAAQRAQIHDHPRLAAELVRSVGGDERLAEIVLSHHECPDGSGYPRGLRGDEIPLAAGILRAADAFVAITETRPYRPPAGPEEALSLLRAMTPGQLDSDVLEALEGVIRDGWMDGARGLDDPSEDRDRRIVGELVKVVDKGEKHESR